MTAVICAAEAPRAASSISSSSIRCSCVGGTERLHDVDVALAAVRLELHLQAVVAEALDLDRGRSDAQGLADRSGRADGGRYR